MFPLENVVISFADSVSDTSVFLVAPKFTNWFNKLEKMEVSKVHITSAKWCASSNADPLKLLNFTADITYTNNTSETTFVSGTEVGLLVCIYVEEYKTHYYVLSNVKKSFNTHLELISGTIGNNGALLGNKFSELREMVDQPVPHTELLDYLGVVDTCPTQTDHRAFLYSWNIDMSVAEFDKLNERIYNLKDTLPKFRVYSEQMLIKLFSADADSATIDAKTEVAYRRSVSDDEDIYDGTEIDTVKSSGGIGSTLINLFFIYILLAGLPKLIM
jgi:hypothetical protein